MHRIGHCPSPPTLPGVQMIFAHQALDALATARDALRPQFRMHTQTSVRLAAHTVDGANFKPESLIALRMRTRLACAGRVKAGTTNIQQTVH